MLILAERSGDFKGLVVSKRGTSISHLFFADDSILFNHATKEEWNKVKAVLNFYEKGSGQMINNQKSSLFFSSNTPQTIQEELTLEVGVICKSYDRDLGLPTFIG